MKTIYLNDKNEIAAIINSRGGTQLHITSKEFRQVEVSEEVLEKKKIGDKLTKEEITNTIKEA